MFGQTGKPERSGIKTIPQNDRCPFGVDGEKPPSRHSGIRVTHPDQGTEAPFGTDNAARDQARPTTTAGKIGKTGTFDPEVYAQNRAENARNKAAARDSGALW